MSDVSLADPKWALLWCRGEDAVPFLQGLLSADLDVPAGQVRRSFLLEPQGKLSAILWVLVGDREVGLVCDAGVADAVAASLNRFRIRVKAEITRDDRPLHLVVGEAPDARSTWSTSGDGIAADVSTRAVPRTLVAGSEPVLSRLSDAAFTAHRVMEGEPVMGRDVTSKTIPQESGLVPAAVSFTKGCYLGQELVARIDSRGHVNQRLVRVEAASELAPGDTIAGERGGTVTSAAPYKGRWLGMMMARREIEDGAEVEINTAAGVVSATVHDYAVRDGHFDA